MPDDVKSTQFTRAFIDPRYDNTRVDKRARFLVCPQVSWANYGDKMGAGGVKMGRNSAFPGPW